MTAYLFVCGCAAPASINPAASWHSFMWRDGADTIGATYISVRLWCCLQALRFWLCWTCINWIIYTHKAAQCFITDRQQVVGAVCLCAPHTNTPVDVLKVGSFTCQTKRGRHCSQIRGVSPGAKVIFYWGLVKYHRWFWLVQFVGAVNSVAFQT